VEHETGKGYIQPIHPIRDKSKKTSRVEKENIC